MKNEGEKSLPPVVVDDFEAQVMREATRIALSEPTQSAVSKVGQITFALQAAGHIHDDFNTLWWQVRDICKRRMPGWVPKGAR